MTRESHTTKRALIRAVNKTKVVYISVRFGVSERSVQITKREALAFIDETLDDSATPHNVEMYGDEFGHTDAFGNVWLG